MLNCFFSSNSRISVVKKQYHVLSKQCSCNESEKCLTFAHMFPRMDQNGQELQQYCNDIFTIFDNIAKISLQYLTILKQYCNSSIQQSITSDVALHPTGNLFSNFQFLFFLALSAPIWDLCPKAGYWGPSLNRQAARCIATISLQYLTILKQYCNSPIQQSITSESRILEAFS